MGLLLYALTAGALLLIVRWRLAIAGRAITWSSAIVLFLLPLVLTGRALATGDVYAPVDLAYLSEPLASMSESVGITRTVNPMASDVFAEFVPWAHALRHVIVGMGQWPLWNPYEGAGGPLAATVQSAPYHPITVVGLLLSAPDGINYNAAMAYLLAALGAFLLARELTSNELASLIAAAGFMLSTHVVAFIGVAHGLALVTLPLVLLGARRLALDPGRRSAALLGGALLLNLLAGHPESSLHVVSIAVVYFVFEVRQTKLRVLHFVAGLAAGIGALLLSAILLLPMFEAIEQSEEAAQRAAGYITQKTTTWPQIRHRLRAYTLPYLDGTPNVEEEPHAPEVAHTWLSTPYSGTLLAALSLYALFAVRSREKWFFLFAIVWGAISGLSPPGYTHLLEYLPGFSFAVNDRLVYFSGLGFSLLAAMGLAGWIDGTDRTYRTDRTHRTNGLVWACLGVAAVIAIVTLVTRTALSPDYVRIGAMRAILPLVLTAAAVLIARTPRVVLVAVMALLLVQRVAETEWLEPTNPREAFYPPFPGLEVMTAPEPFRIVAVGHLLPPLIATHYRLEDVRQFQAITFRRMYEADRLWSVEQAIWSNRADDLNSPFLSAMNVRFALAPSTYVPPLWWEVRGRYGEYLVAENRRVLPRAYVPRHVRVGTPSFRTVFEMRSATDFAEESWIQEGTDAQRVANGPGMVTEVRQRGSHASFDVKMEREGWVVASIPAWRGWRATAGGKPLKIRFANHAFLGVLVPAGEHRVQLLYRPRTFVLGAWISGMTAVLVAAFYALRARKQDE
ncbi:MAG TPA: YfhO family protein [Thermoanaerobaculia bacterium]